MIATHDGTTYKLAEPYVEVVKLTILEVLRMIHKCLWLIQLVHLLVVRYDVDTRR